MEQTQRNRLSSAQREALQQTLKQSWQDMYVLTKPEEIIPYECDGLAAYREIPLVVVLPETEAQVQRVLQTCKQMNIPVVPRGAAQAWQARPCRYPMAWCCPWPNSIASWK